MKKHDAKIKSKMEISIPNPQSSTFANNVLSNNNNNDVHQKKLSITSDSSSAHSCCESISGVSCGNSSVMSDNDEEDADLDSLSQETLSMSDTFYNVLIKDSNDRMESDLETIFDGIQHLPAFIDFTMKSKYLVCKVLKLTLVTDTDRLILHDGQEIDTWNVILNGTVELHCKDESKIIYERGDKFGVSPTLEPQKQIGDMRTKSINCMFASISQEQYHDIIKRNSESIINEFENDGKLELVYEEEACLNDSSQVSKVILRGTVEKLMYSLLNDYHKSDPMFIEHFLMTYRIFIKSPRILAKFFCQQYDKEPRKNDTKKKAIIRHCLLLWVKNHFLDLDDPNSQMSEYLEKIENIFNENPDLKDEKLLFSCSCSNNSKLRSIYINTDNIPFRLVGLQKEWGLFIKQISRNNERETYGLRRGDQILSLSNISWENIENIGTATSMLSASRNKTIKLEVKYNPIEFNKISDYINECQNELKPSNSETLGLMFQTLNKNSKLVRGMENQLRSKRSQSVIKPMILPFATGFNDKFQGDILDLQKSHQRSKSLKRNLCLNSDLWKSVQKNVSTSINQVLKVFRPNSTDYKLVLINNMTSAKEAVFSIMREFSINSSEFDDYSLVLATVRHGEHNIVIEKKCINPSVKNLAGNISLNQRYFLVKTDQEYQLITNDQAKVILSESKVTIYQLTPYEIASRLTISNFDLFRNIRAAEYINYIFHLPPLTSNNIKTSSNQSQNDGFQSDLEGFSNGCENYQAFESLINRQSFWPTSEICGEKNFNNRADLIKKFIKVAKICKDLKNFNSLMCIITGLSLTPVSRLKSCWDKIPTKYIKVFNELSNVTDLSFNFRIIRKLVSPEISEPPLIPSLAIHSKDLAVIHMGNKTIAKDGLVNFGKLRMVSNEIQKLLVMCETDYNIQVILQLPKNKDIFVNNRVQYQWTIPKDYDSKFNDIYGNTFSNRYNRRHNSVDQTEIKAFHLNKTSRRSSINFFDNVSKLNKKRYDEWLSTLKFQTYITNLKVNMNIKELQNLSDQIEPSLGITISSPLNIQTSFLTEKNNYHSKNMINNTEISNDTIKTKDNISSQPTITDVETIIKRPCSIFSYQSQEDKSLIEELISQSNHISRSRCVLLSENNPKHLRKNSHHDEDFLKNLPLYSNQLANKDLKTDTIPASLAINNETIQLPFPQSSDVNSNTNLFEKNLENQHKTYFASIRPKPSMIPILNVTSKEPLIYDKSNISSPKISRTNISKLRKSFEFLDKIDTQSKKQVPIPPKRDVSQPNDK